MASVVVNDSSLDEVMSTTHDVFVGKSYTVIEASAEHLVFERPGNLNKDLAYGSVGGGGTWERAIVQIHNAGGGSYRIQCDVYIVEHDGPVTNTDVKILRLFGIRYQGLLQQVKRRIEGGPIMRLRQ
jgi:hypothetical protein